jgi:tetratricopeptide (TPR) repeat protein
VKLFSKSVIVTLLLLGSTSGAFAKGAGTEWEILNQEVMELSRTGRYDRALIMAKKALEVARKNVGPNHPDVAASLNNLGLLYRTEGHYAQAEPLYKRPLTITEKALGPNHPAVATGLENLAVLYRATKRDAQALELEKRAERIRAFTR